MVSWDDAARAERGSTGFEGGCCVMMIRVSSRATALANSRCCADLVGLAAIALSVAACSSGSAELGGSGADAGSSDSGSAGADARTTWPSVRLSSPPDYLGGVDNGPGCETRYPTAGFEPSGDDGAMYPLFLYFVGTRFVDGDASARFDGEAPMVVTEAMARRGFVALSVDYDNGAIAWLSDHINQLDCLFGAAQPESVLARACALPQVDCDLGIALWGHSQGAFVGVMASSFDDRVRAAWATGYGGDARPTLAKNRLRVVNGETDFNNGMPEVLDLIAGFGDGECEPTAKQCLREDGSGWIIVQRQDLALPELSMAGHCWFDKRECAATMVHLEPNWADPTSNKPFALESNADWVAKTARAR